MTSPYRNPPWLSRNTGMGSMIRVARSLGVVVPLLRRLFIAGATDQASAKAFGDYQATEHDVFVTTYTKSGTNWAMQLAVQIIGRGEAEFEHIHDLVAWPEAHVSGSVPLDDPGPRRRFSTGKRVIKTAIRAPFVPYSERAVYLTVLRDPKDVFVSGYHFFTSLFGLRDHVTPEQWLEMYLSGHAPMGPWPDHAASYWAIRERPNVLVVTFAEMKRDLPAVVRKAAEMIGVDLSEAEVERVVERCSFSHMKANEEKFAPPRLPFVPEPGTMMRTGKAGVSGELLTRAQQARIDRYCIDRLKQLGSDLPYTELFDVVEG